MPIRSTPFQKLVHHIQEQIAPTAVVEESAMLPHPDSGEREVDVWITTEIGGHTLHVALEVNERSRPADITWVEQQHAKHTKLPTNKLVLVSLSGFTKAARKFAVGCKVECYTPAEAQLLDWTTIVGNEQMFFVRYDFTTTDFWIEYAPDSSAPDRVECFHVLGNSIVLFGEEKTKMTLLDVVMTAMNQRGFGSTAMSLVGVNESASLEFNVDCAVPLVVTDHAGREHRLVKLRVKAQVIRTLSPLKLRSLDWKGIPVAFGSGQTVLGNTTLLALERNPGEISARIWADGRELHPYNPREYDATFLDPESNDVR